MLPSSLDQPRITAPARFLKDVDVARGQVVGSCIAIQNVPADQLAWWSFTRSGLPIHPPFRCLAFSTPQADAGAVVIAHSLNGRDAQIVIVRDGRFTWTRSIITAIARWLFLDLDLARLTLRIKAGDSASIDYARRLGATPEGRLRRAVADDADLVLFGMLRDEFPVRRFHK